MLSDICRWVHTTVMAADCMVMKEDHRLMVLETNESLVSHSILVSLFVHELW